MDQEAVRVFLRDTREKRLAIAAAKEYMERTEQDVQAIRGICMDTKVQTNHQFDLAEFVERLEEARLRYAQCYLAWADRAIEVQDVLAAANLHGAVRCTISMRYLWAYPWLDIAKRNKVSRRIAMEYGYQAIEWIAASEKAMEIVTRACVPL